jgi:hypothetical protein
MLGIGPRPEMVGDDHGLAEDCTVEVVAFGRELMITAPDGATFLLAHARSRSSMSLRLADGSPVALGEVVARLLAGAGQDEADPAGAEFAAPKCRTWLEQDALRIDLPEAGPIDLARAALDAPAAPSVSLFKASGELATFDDLLSALSTARPALLASEHVDPRKAPSQECAVDGHPGPDVGTVGSLKLETGPGALPLAIDLPDALAAEPERVALVVVRGLPAGAGLSAGVAGGDGSWLLSPRDLPGLALLAPPEAGPDLALEVAAIAVADPVGELTSATTTVLVSQAASAAPAPALVVEPAPPPPVEPAPCSPIEPAASAARERAPALRDEPVPASIPLGLDLQALSGGGPFDAVIARGVPAGVSLSAGTYDPAIAGWVLLPHQLSGLCVLLARDDGAPFTLSLLGVCLRPGAKARPHVLARVPVSTN